MTARILSLGALLAAVFIFFSPPKYQYELSVAAIFQNEERFLKEWLDYHKAVGVEHFYLYNNLSMDNYLAILKPYIDRGEVELYDWPYRNPDGNEKEWTRIQSAAYRHALDLARNRTKWLAIIDTDEFILPMKTDKVTTFLKDYEDASGILINWQIFGTSNVQRIPDDKLMIETLLYKSPEDHEMNSFCKSICRPERVRTCNDPHTMVYYPWWFSIGPDKKTFHWKFHKTRKPQIDVIRINHYWARDEEFFQKVKLVRYLRWGINPDGCLQRNRDANQVRDTEILRFAPLTQKN